MKAAVYNQKGEKAGTTDLSDSVFGMPWNADLVHQIVTSQEANRRQVTAHAKGRSEVRGGGRKPWRQKGTGRARHGSIRSPLWKGGGVTHGPTKERNFKKKVNKKMAAKALAMVLSAKARDKEILLVDNIVLDRPKTKEAALVLKNLSKIPGYSFIVSNSAMMALVHNDRDIMRAFRNLPNIDLEEARNVTALDVMNHKYLILLKGAVEIFEKRLI